MIGAVARREAADGWQPTVAHFRAALTALVLISAALLFRRPDLLVIATPMAVVTAWSALTRPGRRPDITDRLAQSTIREGEATTWHTDVAGAERVDLVTVASTDMPWTERSPWRGAVTASVAAGTASLAFRLRSTRWGHRLLDPLQVSAVSAWGAFRCTVRLTSRPLTTLPLPAAFDAVAPVHPTEGLVGAHRSARAGEGSEFAGVRPFQPGDRMRRINWSRSLRSEQMQVNATWADQDTHVELVIDSTDDLGTSGGIDGAASSLDITVRAAGAIAEHYARRGDRVSMRCLDPSIRLSVPPAAGEAHLRRILDTLARVTPTGGRRSNVAHRGSAAAADLTVLLSPLISTVALDRAVMLGRIGRSVVVIDTLPDHVVQDDDPTTALAWRIRLLERRREVRAVTDHGVVVLRWRGPGSLDQFLRDVARRSSAPRVRL